MKYTEEQQELIDSLILGDFNEIVENPYTEIKCELEPLAVALHDVIKGAELIGDTHIMRIALSIFVEKWPNEYYMLLD